MSSILKPAWRVFSSVMLCLLCAGCESSLVSELVSLLLDTGSELQQSDRQSDPQSGSHSDFPSDEQMELPAGGPEGDVLRFSGYTCSYSTDTKTPVWVAYELLPEEMEGDADRNDMRFQKAPGYRKPQAMREDYSASGWSRGHMAPAYDFRYSEEAMAETFYLVNICPQDAFLNAHDWEYLERQVRRWAREYGKVWVVTGPVYDEERYGSIGEREVAVPDAFFKAVLVRNRGRYRSIAFTMTNDDSRQYLYDCALSVNALEKLTGIDFFPRLDDSCEESVETQCECSVWGIRER